MYVVRLGLWLLVYSNLIMLDLNFHTSYCKLLNVVKRVPCVKQYETNYDN